MTVSADWDEMAVQLLPKRLREFVRLVGLAATLKLVERFGGTRLYVPARPHADHPLAALIGLDKLEALSGVYAAEDHFDIPKAERSLRHLRDQQIRAEYATKSAGQLAREHGLTERQIFNIVGGSEPDMGSLFD